MTTTPLYLSTGTTSAHARLRPDFSLSHVRISSRPYRRLALTLTDGMVSTKYTVLLPMHLLPVHRLIRDEIIAHITLGHVASKADWTRITRSVINSF